MPDAGCSSLHMLVQHSPMGCWVCHLMLRTNQRTSAVTVNVQHQVVAGVRSEINWQQARLQRLPPPHIFYHVFLPQIYINLKNDPRQIKSWKSADLWKDIIADQSTIKALVNTHKHVSIQRVNLVHLGSTCIRTSSWFFIFIIIIFQSPLSGWRGYGYWNELFLLVTVSPPLLNPLSSFLHLQFQALLLSFLL